MTAEPLFGFRIKSAAAPLGERWPHHRVFLWLAPLIFAAFALLTPPFQTPDEQQHLFRAWQLSTGQMLGEREGNEVGGVLPVSLSRAAASEIGTPEPMASTRPRPIRAFGARPLTPLQPAEQRFTNFSVAALYAPTAYLPQVIGIWIGRALALPVENILRLGRLLNAALAIALLYSAIRLAPFGKNVLLFIGLLPMTAACAASLGQDGLVIGGCCLLLALGLRRWADLPAVRGETGWAAALATAVTLAKPVYLPVVLGMARPLRWRDNGGRRNAAVLLLALVAAAITAGWMLHVASLSVQTMEDVPSAGERLAQWWRRPEMGIELLRQTRDQRGWWLLGTLFTFGWMNIGPVGTAVWTTFLAVPLLLLAGDPPARALGLGGRLWLLLIGIGISFLIVLAAALLWTPRDSAIVSGLQGRYFIPALAPMLIALVPSASALASARRLVPPLQLLASLGALQAIALTYYRF